MWPRRRTKCDDTRLAELEAEHARVLRELSRVRRQEPEVTEMVDRLEKRRIRNHFAESLYLAMGVQKEDH